ncbi:hypothetical protein ACFVYV_25060 [Streptomyces mirabilis]|uniref:hypothetical protein n=1 Tax=Streptomyces mirabilis TaxID=68239 RepID=UPI0036D7DFB6
MSAHVEFPRPYESAPGRFTVDLAFPAQSKRRAQQHHDVAWVLADVHGVEASTPYKVNPRWSVYEENWGNKERHGWLDMRRLTVQGGARAVARYLVALERVLDEVEALATRAVRVFGAWKRSVAAEPHLEYEDASTMRTRAREFRADVLHALVQGLGAPRRGAAERDSSRPLWEQYGAVADEVWAETGGVDLERADEEAVTVQMLRMVQDSEAGRAVVVEAEHLVDAEAARVEEQRARWAAEGAEPAREGQMELFPEDAARVPVVAVWPEVSANRRLYAPAA